MFLCDFLDLGFTLVEEDVVDLTIPLVEDISEVRITHLAWRVNVGTPPPCHDATYVEVILESGNEDIATKNAVDWSLDDEASDPVVFWKPHLY